MNANLNINAETTITLRGPDGKIKHQQTVKAETTPALIAFLRKKGVIKDGDRNDDSNSG